MLTARITSGNVYKGACPFVCIQLIMVALVIIFPQMVLIYKSGEKVVDPSKIEIIIKQEEPQGAGGGTGTDIQPGSPYDPPAQEKPDEAAAPSVQDAFKVPPSEPPKQ